MTAEKIRQGYVDATALAWDSFVKESSKLWSTMKPDINVPGKGTDVFSSKVDILRRRFKDQTAGQYSEYLYALKNQDGEG